MAVTEPHLCNSCADRLGISNYDPKEGCMVCKNVLDSKELLDSIDPNFEYDSFNVGIILPSDSLKYEAELVSTYNLAPRGNIKTYLNEKIRNYLSDKLRKNVALENPDVVFEINFVKERVFYHIKSLTIQGNYCKLDRTIPQTKWICKSCRGKGCKKCNYNGKMYPTSVEEIIAGPLLESTRGKGSKFHGAGREDIDVRMLGDGRPFVIEIISPKIRSVDLNEMQDKINDDRRVHVMNLKYCNKNQVERIKNAKYKKTYVAHLDQKLTIEEISKIETELEGIINQRTPIRVSHRRSDKIRKRKVYKVIGKNNKTTELKIFCDGGLYIKELVSGDEGRTVPSVSSILGKDLTCKELDVTKIHNDHENQVKP